MKLRLKDCKIIIGCIVIGALFYGMGYMMGTANMLNVCIETGEKLLDFTLKPEAVEKLIQRFPAIRELI